MVIKRTAHRGTERIDAHGIPSYINHAKIEESDPYVNRSDPAQGQMR